MFADILCEQKYIIGYDYVGWWLLGYKTCMGQNGVYGGSVNITAVSKSKCTCNWTRRTQAQEI
jgi:hypothetical protein